jgi:oligoribonuclease (3'-5' exoribonuclease)
MWGTLDSPVLIVVTESSYPYIVSYSHSLELEAVKNQSALSSTVMSEHNRKPLIVVVVPRGEAVRNFLYSDTLRLLHEQTRMILLSVVTNDEVLSKARPFVDEIIPIKEHPIPALVRQLRVLLENAHDYWLWSKVAQNNWEIRDRRSREEGKRLKRWIVKASSAILGNSLCLNVLTSLEQYLHWRFRTTRMYDELFARLQPDLVFNGSHIHGLAGELPLFVAHNMGIKTAGFIFSWDNLTSRSRIVVPYDYWLVWHDGMKRQLLDIYPRIAPENVLVTGTPQMDFHFKPEYVMPREELCRRIGIDASRPFVLYTTGIDHHFPQEHVHVELVIRLMKNLQLPERPQLVVRNYIKGTSSEMQSLAEKKIEDVVFPPMLWDMAWATPRPEDLELYCSLVRHAAMSINAASTVTLEFLLINKPVINLDFDPPGTNLAFCDGYKRHIRFDHFWPVAQSGATMVAQSEDDLAKMLVRGLTQPELDQTARRRFVSEFFGPTGDGQSGCRVAEVLLKLAMSNA